MPRKPSKNSVGGAIIAVVVIAIIALFGFIQEYPVVLIIVAVLAALVIWGKYWDKKQVEKGDALEKQQLETREMLEKQRQERALQELLLQRDKEQNELEEQRVQNILPHESQWGAGMCHWLIENKIEYNTRTTEIMNKLQDWGQDTCQNLLQQRIGIGMTAEMVRLAVGEPTSIDQKVITEKEQKYRWVYGIPRQGATYIWFRDGKVAKLKQ